MLLLESIRDEITRKGPITIARYMELALLHPQWGYYQTREPFGAQGDFITAPEISQIFGELMGAWCAERWMRAGKPRATLMELGPGRGTLMLDALRATKHVAGFHDAISVVMVEASTRLREAQMETLHGTHPRTAWRETIEPLPNGPLFVIANEFFDALPVRQFVRHGTGWKERRIGLQENALTFVEENSLFHRAGDADFIEVCEPMQHIARLLAAHIAKHGGSMLVADYGYAQGSGDTLQAMRAHGSHPVLEQPGEADLTAHVDFAALAKAVQEEGLHAVVSTQGDWLRRMGAELRATKLCIGAQENVQKNILSGLERLMSPAQMGELFKVMEAREKE